jgi:hypothetical protein
MARKYVFTPARRAALRKAQAASAKARKQSASTRHAKTLGKAAIRGALTGGPAGAAAAVGHKATGIAAGNVRKRVRKAVPKLPKSIGAVHVQNQSRGTGLSGLKRNTVPYARANVRGTTVGVNAGTIIPGTSKRIVLGGYGRIETARKQTRIESSIAGKKAKMIPTGSKRAKAYNLARRHRLIPSKPATRINIAGSQARLGTSRKGGPTVIVRRGGHKVSTAASKKGIQRYDKRMSTIAGKKVKKPRPQRRNKK